MEEDDRQSLNNEKYGWQKFEPIMQSLNHQRSIALAAADISVSFVEKRFL
jgi:hypothetical protein